MRMRGLAQARRLEAVTIPGEENPLRSLYPYFVGAPTPVDGFIRPSDAPGIGISIDPAAFAE